jgi:hypothetical protein
MFLATLTTALAVAFLVAVAASVFAGVAEVTARA